MKTTNFKLSYEDEFIIEKNERWFKFFIIFPKITTIFFAVVFFILGIVFAFEEWEFILVFWGGGAIFCLINYACTSILLSYSVLNIYYMKKISLVSHALLNDNNKNQVANNINFKTNENNHMDDLPNI